MSSLRSLFENKSSASSGPSTAPPPRPLASHEQVQDDAQKSTRASLDMPRYPSQWLTTATTLSPHGPRTARPPVVPRPLQKSSTGLQRPVSTTSLTAPRSPPLVTVMSSTSSSRSPRLASVQPSINLANMEPSKNISTGSLSPRIIPVPPKRTRPYATAIPPSLSRAKSENGNMNHKPAQKTIDEGPVESITRSIPPPVNRADKPKIPRRPHVMAGRVNLEPLVTAADERISPFSTPPSSDESMGPGSDKLDQYKVSQNEARGLQGKGIVPQAALQSLSGIQRPSDRMTGPRPPISDARRLGFMQGTGSQQAVVDNPPGLPPRRAQEQQRFRAPSGRQVIKATTSAETSSTRYSAAQLQSSLNLPPDILPPPRRNSTVIPDHIALTERSHPAYHCYNDKDVITAPTGDLLETRDPDVASYVSTASDYPEVRSSNRRYPYLKTNVREIDTNYDTRLIDICGQYVCTTGHLTRAWHSTTGDLVLSLGHEEKEVRVTALAFKPGTNPCEEGLRLWLGTNHGDIQEVDIATQSITIAKSGVHDRREIIRIYRHQGSMWTLDDGGKLCVWTGNETGLPDLQRSPFSHRVPKGHTFSIIIQDTLWIATGKDIRIFHPNAGKNAAFLLTQIPLTQPGAGIVTSGAVIGGQLDRVYFGHADGKVTMYSTADFTCLGVVSVSVYKIYSLAGAGFHLWAGYNTGMLCVYDTRTNPWTTRKDWLAHSGPILNITVDRTSLWRDGVLRVVSLGADNTVRFWDGSLEDDWLGGQ